MNKMLAASVVMASLGLVALVRADQGRGTVPQLGKHSIGEVVAALTTEEKAKLLVGMGMNIPIPGLPPLDPEDLKIPEKVPGAAGRTHAIPRLGIPSLTLADGPAGVRINAKRDSEPARTFHATGFPVATLLASTWDAALMEQVGAAFGAEARDYGVDILLAPGLNIHRNPLGGRNFEYYSEDPLVSGRMAAAFVRGVQSKGVGTSLKHFAANNQEFNRMQSDTVVGERALREIYLKGFEVAVKESAPWTVMSSYNLVNGTYTSQSRDLLTTVLRDEWRFGGLVMSDWFAGNDPVAQVNAGNDVIMPGNPVQTSALVAAVASGALPMEQLDRSVRRVLEIVLRSPAFRAPAPSNQPDLAAHARTARAAAADGMVLLRNEAGALPLAPARKIALYGIASYELFAGGTGSGDVNKAYVVSLAQGLTAAGFSLEASLQQAHEAHIAEQKAKRVPPPLPFFPLPPLPERPADPSTLPAEAAAADVAVITIGRSSGEFADRKVEDDFALTAVEQALLRDVAGAFHAKGKQAVVVLNVGGVVEVASWRDRADAILLAWQPGQEGGHAIADVLKGAVNPSGRLATTFPMTYDDVPSARSFPGRVLEGRPKLIDNPFAGVPAEVVYDEGLYVGYRYHDTFAVKPAYEFGYGLSYTDFRFGEASLGAAGPDRETTVSARVTNVGKRPGRTVVQLYARAPEGRLRQPAQRLVAFAKTPLLQPGESQAVSFTVRPADLASFDPERSSWIVEAGSYALRVGSSSRNVHASLGLDVEREVLVETAHRVLPPREAIDELEARRPRR